MGTAKCIKIMGLLTYFAHKWQDKVFLKWHKDCEHNHQCPFEQKLLKARAIDRPFVLECVRRPMKIDENFVEYSARDTETLVKVGLHTSTILCADHNSIPAIPQNMTDYTGSELRLHQAFCKSYSGRLLRFNTVLKPV